MRSGRRSRQIRSPFGALRVDPTGARVRIDDTGLDVDVGINDNGNLDVDVEAD